MFAKELFVKKRRNAYERAAFAFANTNEWTNLIVATTFAQKLPNYNRIACTVYCMADHCMIADLFHFHSNFEMVRLAIYKIHFHTKMTNGNLYLRSYT